MRRGARAKAGVYARGRAVIAALAGLVRDPLLPAVTGLVALSLLAEYVWIGALLNELAFHVALLALAVTLGLALRKRFARATLFGACALFFAQGSFAQMRETRPTPLHGPTLRVAQVHGAAGAPSPAQVARFLATSNVDVLSLTGLNARQAQRLVQSQGDYRGSLADQSGGKLLLTKRSLTAPSHAQGNPVLRLGRCQLELVQVELPSLFAPTLASERKQRIARIAHDSREARRIYVGSFGSASDAADLEPLRGALELRDARIGHGRLATAPAALGPLFGLPIDHILLHGWILARDAESKEPLAAGLHRTLIATLELTEPRCASHEPARR